jgi:hypothetical protein
VALDGNLDVVGAVEEVVGRLPALPGVPAGHDYRPRPKRVDPLGELPLRRRSAREDLGLGHVRRYHRREREQPANVPFDRVVLQQLRAGARHHDRVDDERDWVVLEETGDRLDQLR